MPTTISYPADPITNGATEIQTTNFAVVPADYSPISYNSVRLFMTRNGVKKLRLMPVFPKNDIDPTWSWYMRSDLDGASAAYRNLVGVHIVTTTDMVDTWSPDLKRQVQHPVTAYSAEIHNWYPVNLTLTSGMILTHWLCSVSSIPVVKDPESSALLYGVGASRSLYEAVNFALGQVAASNPTFTALLKLITGLPSV